ncbi:hypothetical protein EV127DRAFT_508297 [Xylaria flabelliformis]|nr:hypothetical protein EV127DRAFT_508297 [Xylaria flabelliformis]
MLKWVSLSCVTVLSGLVDYSLALTAGTAAACETNVDAFSWRVKDFEWRTGYTVWSYSVGVGPAPPPPPTQFYNCGEAMIRMNITTIGANAGRNTSLTSVSCVEQTNDAKLANITDMTDYNPGPWGPPPASPHWFLCGPDQLFIFPNGTLDPWADMNRLDNLTTQIRMDPVNMTLEVRQGWACDDGESQGQVEVTGIADLPPLACRGRSNLEPDANFLINSPVMHGPGLNAPLRNGSVCTGPEFLVKPHTSG